jgi:DNA primase
MDGDAAGLKSAERNMETLIKEDVETKVVELPEECDPCDLLLKRGRDSFMEKVSQAQEFFSFKIKRASEKWDLSTRSGKLAVAREILSFVSRIPDELKKEIAIKHLAEEISIEEKVLRQTLSRQTSFPEGPGGQKGSQVSPGSSKYKDIAEKELLGLLLAHNELIEEYLLEVGHNKLTNPMLNKLAETAFELYKQNGKVTPSDLASLSHQEELARTLADILMNEAKGDYRQRFTTYLYFIKKRENKAKISYTKERIKDSKVQKDEASFLLEFHERSKIRTRARS